MQERALLQHLLVEAGEGRASIVIVSGVAGAGKTALLRWLLAAARERGAVVGTGAPIEDLLPGEILDRLLRPLAAVASGDRDPTDRLVDAARRRLVVLALDDVDQLDPGATRALTDVLAAVDEAAAIGDLHLLVALGSRAPAGPGGLAERALRLDTARAVSLGGFDEHELFELLHAVGAPPDPALVARLQDETGGLPLLVGAALAELAKGEAAGLGAAAQAARLRVRTIADAFRPLLRAVPAEATEVLRVAAVLGESWDPEEVAWVTGQSVASVDAVVEDAVDAGLVVRDDAGAAFTHPLVRTELLRPVGAGARRALHQRVAERLGERGDEEGSEERAVRVAGHLVRATERRGAEMSAGDVPAELVAERAWVAGGIAMRHRAWHQASQLLAAAASALDATGDAPAGERAARHLAAARAAYHDHDPERCERSAAASLAAATEAAHQGDPEAADLRLRAAIVAVRSRVGQPQPPGTRIELTDLDRALAGGAGGVGDPGLQVTARAALAEALFLTGDRARGFALLGEARALMAEHRDRLAAPAVDDFGDDPRFRVELVEGLHRFAGLELAAAGDCFRRARRHTHPPEGGNALTARSREALVRLVGGSVAAASPEMEAVAHLAAERGFWGEAALAAAQRAFVAVLAGTADGEAHVARALRLYRRSGSEPPAAILAPAAAALAARRGLDDPVSGMGATAPPFTRSSVATVLRAVEAGDAEGVRVALSSASWRHGLVGPVTLQNQAIPVALVLAGDLLGDGDLVARAEAPLGDLHEQGAVVALGWPALVPRLLAVCARVAGRHEDAARLVERAVAVGERQQLPVETALTRLEQARVTDDPAGARSVLADAIRRFDALGLHGWVARAEAIAHDRGLGTVAGVGVVLRERTILTTDIVGSTEANARLGDALYVEQLRVHDRIVRHRVRDGRGAEIKHTGDGINAVFDDPGDAVRAALALQADLDRWRLAEPELAFRVRCGLARGRAIPSGGDLFGLVQSEAARLCALAGPGEVVASAAVVDALGADDTRLVVVDDLGERHLRGLPEATRVVRVTARSGGGQPL